MVNKIDMLFIRACKRGNSRRHVMAVYRRFYCRYPNEEREFEYAAKILLRIVEEVNPIAGDRMLELLSPKWFRDKRGFWERALDGLMGWLALTERKRLVGYVPPLAFRRGYQQFTEAV